MIVKKSPTKKTTKRVSFDIHTKPSQIYSQVELLDCRSIASSIPVPFNDEGIQSSNKRRKYMRRGSRAPSMFSICICDSGTYANSTSVGTEAYEENKIIPSLHECLRTNSRRISLTTGLYQQLGSMSISGNAKFGTTIFS
jgi:hypothetical protein